MARKKKVLIIGQSGFTCETDEARIESFAWDDYQSFPNFSDFDVWIISLLKKTGDKFVVESEAIHRQMSVRSMLRVIGNGGTIIVIGDPRKFIEIRQPTGSVHRWEFLGWTGVDFSWDNLSGDTLQTASDEYLGGCKRYLAHLKRWDYSITDFRPNVDGVKGLLANQGIRGTIDIRKMTYCRNRSGNDIALEIQYTSISQSGLHVLGQIHLLPEVDLEPTDAIQLLINDVLGIELTAPEPLWLSAICAPGQEAIDKEIAQILAEQQRLDSKIKDAVSARLEARSCLKVLYVRNLELEIAVREMLRAIGAKVEEPTQKNKEDGWICIQVSGNTLNGVLEIKSTQSDQFSEEPIRQLSDWQIRGIQHRQIKFRKIFIGNNATETAPSSRPFAFSDSWLKSAELSEVSALKTEVLYDAYCLHLKRRLNCDAFWQDLFTTNGVVSRQPSWDISTSPSE